MGAYDVKANAELGISIDPDTYTAAATASSVDVSGGRGAMVAIIAGSYTDGTHAFEVQESDDDSTYSAVADSDLDGSEPTVDAAGDADQVYHIGYTGTKKFLKVVPTVSGTTSGAQYAAVVVKGMPRQGPFN